MWSSSFILGIGDGGDGCDRGGSGKDDDDADENVSRVNGNTMWRQVIGEANVFTEKHIGCAHSPDSPISVPPGTAATRLHVVLTREASKGKDVESRLQGRRSIFIVAKRLLEMRRRMEGPG